MLGHAMNGRDLEGPKWLVQSMRRALTDLVKGECDADDRSDANDDSNGRRCHADGERELP